MVLEQFINKVKQDIPVTFDETLSVIAIYYEYKPTEFTNGLGNEALVNVAGTNEGSCKIFAFAKLNGLNEQQTLNLFGDYYRVDVLQNPDGTGHQNIRNFMKSSWEGIRFAEDTLSLQRK
jgi:HopJ type III effector protein